MRSSISNFKERLRLPRLFFRKPSREEQIHGGPPRHRCDDGVGVVLSLAWLCADAQ